MGWVSQKPEFGGSPQVSSSDCLGVFRMAGSCLPQL